MLNFEFRRSSKKCSVSERVLQPGEDFYSALIEKDGETQRLDFSVENWKFPPENCLGWWKSKVPEVGKGKIYWAPRSVMLAYFEHLTSQPTQVDVAYITGLLLAQKKILAMEDSIDDPPDGATMMCLKDRKTNQVYEIPVVDVSPARLAEIQQELAERLFMDHPFEEEDGEEVASD